MEEIIINTNFLDFLKTSELLNLELLNKKFNEKPQDFLRSLFGLN